jgi:hypothetical protein
MNYLFLIISSNDVMCYSAMKEYAKKYYYPYKYYFIEMDNTLDTDIKEIGDTIFVKGNESIIPGIYIKTIKAIQHVQKYSFDFLIRTNLSSFWNFNHLKTLHLPLTNYAGGIIIFNQFISGTGIILSKDVSNQLSLHETNDHDDVYISKQLQSMGITLSRLDDSKMIYLTDGIFKEPDLNALYFRIKNQDRNVDIQYFNFLYNKLNLKSPFYKIVMRGEDYQTKCDIFLGFLDDFNFNPYIASQINKHVDLDMLKPFSNPLKIFCYTHRIHELSMKLDCFQNDFILVTHNSDGTIFPSDEVFKIVNHPKVIKWYSQNVLFEHEKLHMIPIGLANRQWPHGNVSFQPTIKTKKVYFNFNIHTNPSKRQPCYEALKNKLEWLPGLSPQENINRLQEHEFCICPEGNGVDTHRLWEALYSKTIPIVLDSDFTKILQKNNIPLIVLKKWDDLDVSSLVYNTFDIPIFYLE